VFWTVLEIKGEEFFEGKKSKEDVWKK